nr:cobalamin biosynthesis protein [Sulfodiicoccus acidiphilus]
MREIGVRGVAEACALMAAGPGSRLLMRKIPYRGQMTVAAAAYG